MQDNYVMKKEPELEEKLFSYQTVDVVSKDKRILLEKVVLLDYNSEWFTVRMNGEVKKFLTSEASIQA